VVAGRAQELLPAHHLAGQGVLHPVDQGQLLGKVGDHRRDVRQLAHAGERRATLEVDQHQVELLGGVCHRYPQHQSPQELGLAGPGGADHQAMRPHALLGRLLDVEVHQGTRVGQPDRDPEPIPDRPGTPRRPGVEGVDVAEPQEIHEVRQAGEVGGAG
jgi:hypothetical protein